MMTDKQLKSASMQLIGALSYEKREPRPEPELYDNLVGTGLLSYVFKCEFANNLRGIERELKKRKIEYKHRDDGFLAKGITKQDINEIRRKYNKAKYQRHI